MGKKGKRKRLRELADNMKSKRMIRTITKSHEDIDPIIFGGDEEEEKQQQNLLSSLQGSSQTRLSWKKQKQQQQHNIPSLPEYNEKDEKLAPEDLQSFLESYTKDDLISLISDAAVDDQELLSLVKIASDRDITHRKIFIHGLGWDVTTEILFNTFRPFGIIMECNLVLDRATGRNKGFGFVVYSTRKAAAKALKSPQKKIGFRTATCNLASLGSTPSSSSTTAAQRRVYVSNVHSDASSEKLKSFFATFGEIDSGPAGFDPVTGKSRGFAIFVYKTQDGATRALQEPYKMFEGHQLHCMLASDHSQKGQIPAPQAVIQSLPITYQHLAHQKLAMPGQNPSQSMFIRQNPLITNAILNQRSIAALNPAAFATFNTAPKLATPQGQSYSGLGGGSSIFGTYGAQQNVSLPYGGSQVGQTFSGTPATGFLWGFPQ